MNRPYIIVLLVLLSFSANAQIKKNSTLLGGQLSYGSDKTKLNNIEQKATGGSIGISLGKAFKENSVFGINLSYFPLKQAGFLSVNNDTTTTTFNGYSFGVFYRQYKKLAKDFYFFGEASGSFIMNDQKEAYKNNPGNVYGTQRGFGLYLTPGISYQIFKIMQMEITIPNILSFQYLKTKFDSQNPYVKNSERDQLLFYSNVNNNTSLSWLGIGFRFVW